MLDRLKAELQLCLPMLTFSAASNQKVAVEPHNALTIILPNTTSSTALHNFLTFKQLRAQNLLTISLYPAQIFKLSMYFSNKFVQ